MQPSTQASIQLLNLLTLLQTKQTVETLEAYKEFCYQLFLLATYEVRDDGNGNIEEIDYIQLVRAMDYGTNNNTLANTVIQTARAFTGHEQIKEISGLIHMNARLYDSDIGRFLSADTIIQYPYSSQGYNRYSYIENNPLMAADPSGHGFWSKFKREVRRVGRQIKNNSASRVVVGAVLIIGGGVLTYGGNPFGPGLMGIGVDLLNYDPNKPASPSNQIGISIQVNTPLGGSGGTSEAAQVTALQEQSAIIDRANAGVATTSASPVTNNGYASGASTASYENTQVPTNADGIPVLTVTNEYRFHELGVEDYVQAGYTAWTYTNIGGVVDVGVQYANGEIGGYYAAGLTGMALIGGGGAVKGFEASRKGYRLFHGNGTLTNLGLNNSKDIMNYAKLTRSGENPRLQLGYSKYTTKPYSAPNGRNVETHFYADPNNGIIDYGLDYKTKLPTNYWE